jgi:hypothetical protein
MEVVRNKGCFDVAKVLMQYGADINIHDMVKH